MKKSILLFSMLALGAGTLGGVLVANNESAFKALAGEIPEKKYEIVIDNTNGAIEHDIEEYDEETITAKVSDSEYTKEFGVSCATFKENIWCNLDCGFFYNKTEIQGIKSITVERPEGTYDTDLIIRWGWNECFDTSCEDYNCANFNPNCCVDIFECEDDNSITFDFYDERPSYFYLENWDERCCDISKITIEYSCQEIERPSYYDGYLDHITICENSDGYAAGECVRSLDLSSTNGLLDLSQQFDYRNGEKIKFNYISQAAFSDHSEITDINFGDVYCIESNGFERTGIENLVIPNTITRIGGNAFSQCNQLESVLFKSRKGLDDIPIYLHSDGTIFNLIGEHSKENPFKILCEDSINEFHNISYSNIGGNNVKDGRINFESLSVELFNTTNIYFEITYNYGKPEEVTYRNFDDAGNILEYCNIA